MAVGDESIGYGAILEIDDGGNGAVSDGASFEELPKITNLGVPSRKTNVVESKTLDTPAKVIRKIAAMADGGEFSIKWQLTNAQWVRMEAIRAAHLADGTHHLFRITVQDDDGDTVIEVPGILTENKIDPLEPEKITEVESMVTVSGCHPDEE